jgi:protein-disulfide isomerase
MSTFKDTLKSPIFITVVVIAIAIAGGLFALFKLVPDEDIPSASYVERSWGKADAQVVVTEYADFNCSGCESFYQNVEKNLKQRYSDKIKFVFKHYPLELADHNTAKKAAEAAEAAGAQGKFWEYHDLLFDRQAERKQWTVAKLVEYAKELNLDTEKFKKELNENYYRKVVRDSVREALDNGYTGTPTVLVNGKKVTDPSLLNVEKAITDELAAKSSVSPTPTPAIGPAKQN